MTSRETLRVVRWLRDMNGEDLAAVALSLKAEAERRQPARRRRPETLALLAALGKRPVPEVAAEFHVARQWCYQLLREEGLKPIRRSRGRGSQVARSGQ